jgi:hypothetical protein
VKVRLIIGIAALVCASVCGFTSALVSLDMVDRVNERLPESERFELLGWYLDKHQRLSREYKRLYPDGRLLRKIHVLTAVMFGCALVCVWGFGFFE